MVVDQFVSLCSTKTILPEGEVKWVSPSNIALVKYWGKYGDQMPQNPSISFTLSNCNTATVLHFKEKVNNEPWFKVFLDGKREEGFEPKINTFFERILIYVPFIKDYTFEIATQNSFPHSSGIASSASGMSALALCIMDIERKLNPEITECYFFQKASFLARLGSGSACRSIGGPLVSWGTHDNIKESSQLFGTRYTSVIHKNFENYQDTILLVDKGQKQVSSTVGHDLMHGHAFAKARFEQAHVNLSELMQILATGNLDDFIKIVESEALTLHAMMMTSHPYFILMKPKTLEIINLIWKFRAQTDSKVCFTLDAGANVHVLYPESEKETVQQFIESQLSLFCENGQFIHDQAGLGAFKA